MSQIHSELARAVRTEIATAKTMHNDILHLAPDKLILDTDVKQIVGAFFTLALEHHGSILILLEQGGSFDGSAFALMRPFVEAVYRGHWIQCCAKSEIVKRIRNGEENCYPGLRNMAEAVEAAAQVGGVFTSIIDEIGALHGYTHGGLEQLARRFDKSGNLRATYRTEEKIELIRSSTAFVTLFAITWCQMIGGATPSEPRSAAITTRYMALYPPPTELSKPRKPLPWEKHPLR